MISLPSRIFIRALAPLLGGALIALAPAQGPRRSFDDSIPPQVDGIYERGLKYLAERQSANGTWSDQTGSEPGVVGLALIAFLAKGEDPNHGPYARPIRRALDYLISQQRASNGYIGSSMYNHGFATLALAEAYGMVDHPEVAEALRKAVDLILNAQERNPSGAWRYTPESRDADTTVAGCQIVALLGARNAGIPVPDDAIRKALAYMARCRGSDGGYGYTSAGSSKVTLTAIGVTCLALAKEKDGKGFARSTEYLRDSLNYRDSNYPYYFEYYMAQALFHADDAAWEEWNRKNIRYLSVLQRPDGSWPGNKGEAFSTSGALLSLALNYRFLPIYEK